MEQTSLPCEKSSVKRNLNDSFNDNAFAPPILHYSINTSDDDNSLNIKLRKSTKFKQRNQRSMEEEVLTNINLEYGDDESSSDSNCSIIASSTSEADSSNEKSLLNGREFNLPKVGNPFVILEQMDIQGIANKENNLENRSCKPKKKVPAIRISPKRSSSPRLLESVIQNKSLDNCFSTSSPNESVRDAEKLFKDSLKISEYPCVHLENLNLGVRKSSRIRKEVLYKEYQYVHKTPSKRNRKLSTDSNSSAVISTPKKKCSPQKYKIQNNCNKLLNASPKKIHTKNLMRNHHVTPKKNRNVNGNINDSPNKKSSTPLKKAQYHTPVKDRTRRTVNTPIRFRNFDDKMSPTKRKKNEEQCRETNSSSDEESTALVKDFAKIRVRNNTEINTPHKKYQENTTKHVYIDLQKANVRNIHEVRTPTKKDHSTKDSQTPKSTMKNTPSAKAKLVRNGVITPSVQLRATPIKKDSTPLNKARTKLHVSYLPKKLACREKEYDNIFNFLEGKLSDGCGGCMYVSGVPGTGKTATVTDVIRKLQEKSENDELPDFQFVSINGMKLSEPRQSYVEILRQLTGKTASWEQAQSTLDTRFTRPGKKTLPIILLVDELDILCTKRQDVVYNLLDWPTRASTQLIVITIANTMDLPERLLMGRVTSRLGLTRLTFQAYTHKQLQEIVTLRLMGTKVFNPDAVQLVARKVASVSGDARRALDICRRAAEIAELEGPNTLVSMPHVNEALNAMITQPKVKAIRDCSRLQQLILQSVVAEVERTGVEETIFSDVYRMFESVTAIDGFQKVSYTLALAAISRLGACRLLLTDQKSNDFHQKLILNVSADDVYYALRND